MPISEAQEKRIQAERLRAADIRRQRAQDVDSHVQAIKAARGDIEGKLHELQGHCDRLQQAARRAGAEDGVARYRLYHTAQARMAGALSQVLKRAKSTDRLLEARGNDEQEREREQREAESQARVQTAVRDIFDLQLPKENDIESLFGEGVMDAS